jgi:alpha-N-arabinofuranosidase
MLLTPTYHVFDMYKVHQDAVKLPVYVESETVEGMAAVSASASEDNEGRIHISVTNIDVKNEAGVKVELRGLTVSPSAAVHGQVVSAENMTAHNTFDRPDTVKIKDFNGASITGGGLVLTIPPMAVVTVELA